ncbi:hypothetical protein F2981_25010 (plasmid) [Sinorhizobium meliloti]|nr:hypothetical protein [Sinorhizobium meliloti]
MATDVVALMDFLGLQKAAIVGWSDGAIIGLKLGDRPCGTHKQGVRFRTRTASRQASTHWTKTYFKAYLDRGAAKNM